MNGKQNPEEMIKFKQVVPWMESMKHLNFSTVTISHRKNRNARPTELCHLLSMRAPESIATHFAESTVVMFHVKTNDKGAYIGKIMLEG